MADRSMQDPREYVALCVQTRLTNRQLNPNAPVSAGIPSSSLAIPGVTPSGQERGPTDNRAAASTLIIQSVGSGTVATEVGLSGNYSQQGGITNISTATSATSSTSVSHVSQTSTSSETATPRSSESGQARSLGATAQHLSTLTGASASPGSPFVPGINLNTHRQFPANLPVEDNTIDTTRRFSNSNLPPPVEDTVRQCRVCYSAEMDTVFIPCGHMATCTECARNLSVCPICRTSIRGSVRAYIA